MSMEKQELTLKKIAVIHTDFREKFGIPRQSGLADSYGRIVFEPEYRKPEAFKGLEEYSHLWLIWGFSENFAAGWHPTVRPPRLGGNIRVGVFGTRSPFRPNPLGLSCVELAEIRIDGPEGPELLVQGADMLDGTPVYDIKPYLPYVDSRPEAAGGFAERKKDYRLEVKIPEELERRIPQEHRKILRDILSQDPRPSYQEDEARIYGMAYGELEVKFRVARGVLRVCGIEDRKQN